MKRFLTITGILIIPLAWLGASVIAGTYIIPAPWTTLYDTILLLGSGETWRTILITLARVLLGFFAAMIAGTFVGVLTSKKAIEYLLRPTILLMQGVPPILWSIPLILIMGFNRITPVVVIAAICFPLAVTNISEGMRTVPKDLREMLEIYAPGRFPRLRELIIPHLRPFILASVRLGLGLGIKVSVVAEYFAANNGIGFQVQTAYQSFLVRNLFSWALILVLIILGADYLIRRGADLLDRYIERRQSRPVTVSPSPDYKLLEQFRSLPKAKEAISADNITFAYPGQPEILSNQNLRVATGDTVVISGDSGCGKTTFLKLLAGILQPREGRLRSPDRLGFLFQDDRFLPWHTNLYNTALALRYGGYSREQARSFAAFMLEKVGLTEQASQMPHELSGGMKKRLAFARSFACMPDAVFLDEPFTGLHQEARAELWRLFQSLNALRPVPVVVVTHFPEEVPFGPGVRHLSLG